MKPYRRILVPIFSGAQNDILLERAAELAKASHTQMLALHIIDTRSGFEPDGPAAALPEESAARRAPAAKKNLDLQLARNNLSWVEAKVAWGEPKAVLADVVRDWKPDLVVTFSAKLPNGIAYDCDILNIAGSKLLRRMAEALRFPIPKHA